MGKTSLNYYREAGLELCFKFSPAKEAIASVGLCSHQPHEACEPLKSTGLYSVRDTHLYSRAQMEASGRLTGKVVMPACHSKGVLTSAIMFQTEWVT